MIATIQPILEVKMAAWTGAKISWPNTPPLTSTNTPWVRFSVVPFDRTWPTSGAQRIMDGEIVVQVFVPSGGGAGQARTLADSIGAHFSKYAQGGVQCGEPKAPVVVGEVGANLISDAIGGWYQINAVIPWRAEL